MEAELYMAFLDDLVVVKTLQYSYSLHIMSYHINFIHFNCVEMKGRIPEATPFEGIRPQHEVFVQRTVL